jgi:hypothetical protein
MKGRRMHYKQWRVEIDTKPCEIAVQHGSLFRRYKIFLNGTGIEPSETILLEKGNRITFDVENHLCNILVTYNGKFEYDLIIDGTSIQTNRHIDLPERWEPKKKGFFQYILDNIILWLVIGALAVLIGIFTGDH